jgi:tetratricopeptide (TPR) repeat protein
METGLRVQMGVNRRLGKADSSPLKRFGMIRVSCIFEVSVFLFLLPGGILANAQSPAGTVRHHRVEEPDPTVDLLTQAETALGKQDYVAAEPLLKKYLETYPDSYAGWYDLGYVYRGLGRRDDSIAAYRKSVAAKADVFESNLNLGLVLADAANPEAEQFLRAATRLKPSSGNTSGNRLANTRDGQMRAWMALGRFLVSSKPDEAVSAFGQAAALDPKDPEPHLAAGSLLEKSHPAEAEKEYHQALAAAPDSVDAMTALANLYQRERRFSDAEPLLRQLVAFHPNDAGAHLQLGRMLAISGHKQDAVSELETGLKLDPSDHHAQRDLAELYGELGKYDEAQEKYRVLLASEPGDAELHDGYGRALLKQKKFAEAQQELMKAVQLRPDWGEAYGDLAVAANENKDYATAIKATDLRAKYLPEIPMSYFLRATAYDHLRDAKQAARYYHQFLEVAAGQYPEQEWQARHRLIAIEPKK